MTKEEMVEVVKGLFRDRKRFLGYLTEAIPGDREALERVILAETMFLEMVGGAKGNETKVVIENERLA